MKKTANIILTLLLMSCANTKSGKYLQRHDWVEKGVDRDLSGVKYVKYYYRSAISELSYDLVLYPKNDSLIGEQRIVINNEILKYQHFSPEVRSFYMKAYSLIGKMNPSLENDTIIVDEPITSLSVVLDNREIVFNCKLSEYDVCNEFYNEWLIILDQLKQKYPSLDSSIEQIILKASSNLQ